MGYIILEKNKRWVIMTFVEDLRLDWWYVMDSHIKCEFKWDILWYFDDDVFCMVMYPMISLVCGCLSTSASIAAIFAVDFLEFAGLEISWFMNTSSQWVLNMHCFYYYFGVFFPIPVPFQDLEEICLCKFDSGWRIWDERKSFWTSEWDWGSKSFAKEVMFLHWCSCFITTFECLRRLKMSY